MRQLIKGEYMMRSILMIGFLLLSLKTFGKSGEAVVIEVRKKVKLHDLERVYADYYIKGGRSLGLEKGVLVSVVRRLPVHDPFDNASVGDFKVKVADVEIIHADADKSIGRLVEIDRREARPMLTFDAIMIGDRLDLDSLRAKVAYLPAPQSVFESQRRMPAAEVLKPVHARKEGVSPQLSGKNPQPLLTKPLR